MSDDEKDERNKVENDDQECEQNLIVDSNKLQNLLKRRNVYGDIIQNVSERQIKRLLVSRKLPQIDYIDDYLYEMIIHGRYKHFIILINL